MHPVSGALLCILVFYFTDVFAGGQVRAPAARLLLLLLAGLQSSESSLHSCMQSRESCPCTPIRVR